MSEKQAPMDTSIETELLASILKEATACRRETTACREKLGAIASWVAFFGVLVLLGIVLGACSAIMGVGGLMGL